MNKKIKIPLKKDSEFDDFSDEQLGELKIFLTLIADVTIETYLIMLN